MKEVLKKNTMFAALFALFLLFTLLTGGRMLYAQNLSNLLLQNAYVFVLACGMLPCILTGGNIDLSVGSMVCLVGAISVRLLEAGLNAYLVVLIALAAGAVIGSINGFLIGHVHVPSFVCTLAGMFFLRGLARVILESKTIAIANDRFLNLFMSYLSVPGLDGEIKWSALIIGGVIAALMIVIPLYRSRARAKTKGEEEPRHRTLAKSLIPALLVLFFAWELSQYKGIPVMALWVLLVVLSFAFLLSKTVYGRHFYVVGGNRRAARLSGIDTDKVCFRAHFSMSILAALAGLLVAARIGSVNGDTGNSFEMDAISACFIGGASAYGGKGDIKGVVIGALFLGVINQGMSIIGLDSNLQLIVKGVVLLTAVVFDVVSKKKDAAA